MAVVTLNTYRILESVRIYPAKTIRKGFQQILSLDPELQQLVTASGGEDAVMKSLYQVFKESIKENNADKRYWLAKLNEINKISQKLDEYLKELLDDSKQPDDPYQCESKQEPLSWLPKRKKIIFPKMK